MSLQRCMYLLSLFHFLSDNPFNFELSFSPAFTIEDPSPSIKCCVSCGIVSWNASVRLFIIEDLFRYIALPLWYPTISPNSSFRPYTYTSAFESLSFNAEDEDKIEILSKSWMRSVSLHTLTASLFLSPDACIILLTACRTLCGIASIPFLASLLASVSFPFSLLAFEPFSKFSIVLATLSIPPNRLKEYQALPSSSNDTPVLLWISSLLAPSMSRMNSASSTSSRHLPLPTAASIASLSAVSMSLVPSSAAGASGALTGLSVRVASSWPFIISCLASSASLAAISFPTAAGNLSTMPPAEVRLSPFAASANMTLFLPSTQPSLRHTIPTGSRLASTTTPKCRRSSAVSSPALPSATLLNALSHESSWNLEGFDISHTHAPFSASCTYPKSASRVCTSEPLYALPTASATAMSAAIASVMSPTVSSSVKPSTALGGSGMGMPSPSSLVPSPSSLVPCTSSFSRATVSLTSVRFISSYSLRVASASLDASSSSTESFSTPSVHLTAPLPPSPLTLTFTSPLSTSLLTPRAMSSNAAAPSLMRSNSPAFSSPNILLASSGVFASRYMVYSFTMLSSAAMPSSWP